MPTFGHTLYKFSFEEACIYWRTFIFKLLSLDLKLNYFIAFPSANKLDILYSISSTSYFFTKSATGL